MWFPDVTLDNKLHLHLIITSLIDAGTILLLSITSKKIDIFIYSFKFSGFIEEKEWNILQKIIDFTLRFSFI